MRIAPKWIRSARSICRRRSTPADRRRVATSRSSTSRRSPAPTPTRTILSSACNATRWCARRIVRESGEKRERARESEEDKRAINKKTTKCHFSNNSRFLCFYLVAVVVVVVVVVVVAIVGVVDDPFLFASRSSSSSLAGATPETLSNAHPGRCCV
jgi:hypothetical protein